ncbi:hypothetical protein [Xenorhabdus innexi]|uniref:Uncharacterized protein n=1 Tax=Xenorhabdus innexi TaxID=290109 RepID=A0A1N6MWL6_9GAMM|nr:hypothetical protein [Xenorhabdus innexi]PHM35968.1 hypothetical protein Xinn_02038 [Xenorhabdus innexi]SIP73268.1 hypothetical protein XIS1_1790074 [Xenorhabdus innexi]
MKYVRVTLSCEEQEWSYDAEEDLNEEQLIRYITDLQKKIEHHYKRPPAHYDKEKLQMAEHHLQCLKELHDRRQDTVSLPFMSKTGDWVLMFCLIGMLYLIIRPLLGIGI